MTINKGMYNIIYNYKFIINTLRRIYIMRMGNITNDETNAKMRRKGRRTRKVKEERVEGTAGADGYCYRNRP